MKTLYTVLAFCLFAPLVSQNVNFDWAEHVSGDNEEIVYTLTTDNSGNVYAAGKFYGFVNFATDTGVFSLNDSKGTGFICKLKATGKLEWAIQVGGAVREIVYDENGSILCIGSFDFAADFDPGTDSLILTPSGTYDTYISKVDTSGNLIWAKQVGGNEWSGVNGERITIDKSGNIYSIGTFSGKVDFDPSPAIFEMTTAIGGELFILKLNAQGQFLYAKMIGVCYATGIKTDSENSVLISGFFPGPFDVDPGSGQHLLNSASMYDGFVLKLDSNASFIWAFSQAGLGYNYLNAMAVDANNNILVTGGFEGTCDFNGKSGTYNLSPFGDRDAFIAKYQPNGDLVWVRQFTCTHSADGLSIFALQNGTVISTGYFTGTCDFHPGNGTVQFTASGTGYYGEDAFVSALSKNGDYVYAGQIGVTGYCLGLSITSGIGGTFYIGGFFEGTIDVDPTSSTTNLTATDYIDGYICKLSTGSSIGIDQSHVENEVFIYPNPSSGRFTVNLPIGMSKPNVAVFDIWGQTLQCHVYPWHDSLEISLSVPPGTYIVKITTEQGEITQRVVVYDSH